MTKLRTWGRQHAALHEIRDGEWHKRKDMNYHGILAITAKFVERLLIYGLVERSSYDVTKKTAKYRITELGKKALAKLEEVQPFEEMKDTSYTVNIGEVPEEEKEFFPDGKLHFTGDVAHHGYKLVEVETRTDERWQKHFSKYTW